MSWNGKQGMKLSGGLGNSVFHPKVHIYPADGSGRDVHCFMHPRSIDTMQVEANKFNTQLGNTGKKSPVLQMPSEHVPRRRADGSGRDGYIHFDNGGLCHDYKPGNFGQELRAYKIINKPRFGKHRMEFDDYQTWFDKRASNSKAEQARAVKSLVERLNPTSRKSQDRERDQILHGIVQTLQQKSGGTSRQMPDVDVLCKTFDSSLSRSPSPQPQVKQVTTLEQKRIRRKVLKVFDTEDGNFTKKMRAEGEISLPQATLIDHSIDNELNKLREKQVSPFHAQTTDMLASFNATAYSTRQEPKKMFIARMGRNEPRERSLQEADQVLHDSPNVRSSHPNPLSRYQQNATANQQAAKNKNMVDLFVNDNIMLPKKKSIGRNVLCKSVQGTINNPEKRLKLERIITLNRDLPQTPVGLSVTNMSNQSRAGGPIAAAPSRTTVFEHLTDQLLPLTQENFAKFDMTRNSVQHNTAYVPVSRDKASTAALIESKSRFGCNSRQGSLKSRHISIRPSRKTAKPTNGPKIEKQDSKSSLHAISICAGSQRQQDSRCNSIAGKSESSRQSIVGKLAQRLRAQTKATERQSSKQTDTRFNHDVERMLQGVNPLQHRPQTQIKGSLARTALAEKQKIVDQTTKHHSEFLDQKELTQQYREGSEVQTKHKQYKQISKAIGQSPSGELRAENNASPFGILKYY